MRGSSVVAPSVQEGGGGIGSCLFGDERGSCHESERLVEIRKAEGLGDRVPTALRLLSTSTPKAKGQNRGGLRMQQYRIYAWALPCSRENPG